MLSSVAIWASGDRTPWRFATDGPSTISLEDLEVRMLLVEAIESVKCATTRASSSRSPP
jgi:hypothetical protein